MLFGPSSLKYDSSHLLNVKNNRSLQWRHNERDGVSNHQPHDCLLKRLFRRRSKKISKVRVTGLCEGNSPHIGPVTRKMFPFDDVIICVLIIFVIPLHALFVTQPRHISLTECYTAMCYMLHAINDDVIKWKHFPRYWPFVWGIHRPPVNSPHKGQWRGALMFSLICARING